MKYFLPALKKSSKRITFLSVFSIKILPLCFFFLTILCLPIASYAQLAINKIAIKDSDNQQVDNANPLLAGEDFWYVITFSVNTSINDQIVISDVFAPSADIEPVDADPSTTVIEPVIAISNSLFTIDYTNPNNAGYTNPYNQNNQLDFAFTATNLNTPSTTSEIRIKMRVKEDKLGNICPPGISISNTATISTTGNSAPSATTNHSLFIASDFQYNGTQQIQSCLSLDNPVLYEIRFNRSNINGNINLDTFYLENDLPTGALLQGAWLQIGGGGDYTTCLVTQNGNQAIIELPNSLAMGYAANTASFQFYLLIEYPLNSSFVVGQMVTNTARLYYDVANCSSPAYFVSNDVQSTDEILASCPAGGVFTKNVHENSTTQRITDPGVAQGTYFACCRSDYLISYASNQYYPQLIIEDTFPAEVRPDNFRFTYPIGGNLSLMEIKTTNNTNWHQPQYTFGSYWYPGVQVDRSCTPTGQLQLPDDVTHARWTFDNVLPGSFLAIGISFQIRPSTSFTPGTQIQNCANIFDPNTNATTPFDTQCATFEIGDEDLFQLGGIAPAHQPSKFILNEKTTYFPSDTISYRILVGNSKTRDLNGLTIKDQLPNFANGGQQLNLIPNSIRYAFNDANWQGAPISPSYVTDPNTLGMGAVSFTNLNHELTWQFANFPSDCLTDLLYIEYDVIIDPSSSPGEVCNGFSLASTDSKWTYGLWKSDSICFDLSRGVALLEAIKTLTPASPLPGAIATYSVEIFNKGQVGVKDLTLIDVLPYGGDQLILTPSIPRSTDCLAPIVLAGAGNVQVNGAFTINQTTFSSQNPDLSPIGVTGVGSDIWQNSPLAQTQAIQIQLDGTILNPGNSVIVNFEVQLPSNLTLGCMACNSFAYQGVRSDDNLPLLASEGNPVCIELGTCENIYPEYDSLTLMIKDPLQTAQVTEICNNDPAHFCLLYGNLIPPSTGVNSIQWEYNDDGNGWQPITDPAFQDFCFVVPPGKINTDCSNSPTGFVNRAYRANIEVVDANLMDTCLFTSGMDTVTICCPITMADVLIDVDTQMCEGDMRTINVSLDSDPFVVNPVTGSLVTIVWDTNGVAIPSLANSTTFSLPIIAGTSDFCVNVTVTNCGGKERTGKKCISVDPMPQCGTITGMSTPPNLTQDQSNPNLYYICPGDDAAIGIDQPFANCTPQWEYTFDLINWQPLGFSNSVQNTNVLPSGFWPTDTTAIFYRIACQPLSTPSACDPCYSDTLEIRLQDAPIAVNINGNSPICLGNNSTLTITNPQTDPNFTINYTWLCNGVVVGTGNSYQANQNGCYWVEATNGCQITTSNQFCLDVCEVEAIISCPLMPNECAYQGQNVVLSGCASQSTCGNAGMTYQWAYNNGTLISTNGCTIEHLPDPAGTTYTLTVTDANGCSAFTTRIIKPCAP